MRGARKALGLIFDVLVVGIVAYFTDSIETVLAALLALSYIELCAIARHTEDKSQ